MVLGLLLLVGCQLAGEFVARAFAVSVPGPVVGMALLGAVLLARGRRRCPTPADPEGGEARDPGGGEPRRGTSHGRSPVERASDGLIAHLQLLFVPAGAGVVVYLPELVRSPWPVVGGLTLGWAATLLATAATAMTALWWTERLTKRRPGPAGCPVDSAP